MNLSARVGDDAAAVVENRSRWQATLGARPLYLAQVHGRVALEVDLDTPDEQAADASSTTARGLACTVLAADCMPVLLCDEAGTRVAAAHAGWRGLAGGVLESAYEHFVPQTPVDPAGTAIEIIAWLGPCIGPQAFEVGPEVKAAFEAHAPEAAACFRPGAAPGKWLADLPALARQRLAALGVRAVYGNDGSPRWCTVANPSLFFSHRRDGVGGRFAAAIWRI